MCNDLDLGKTCSDQTQNRGDEIRCTFQGAFLMYTFPHVYDDVRAHIQELLDIGAIWKLHSPWASAVVLVWKKDSSLRFCIDLKKLNSWTIKDAYSLPCIDMKHLIHFQGSQWFSSLNLKFSILAGQDG